MTRKGNGMVACEVPQWAKSASIGTDVLHFLVTCVSPTKVVTNPQLE
jgi:hypothetical protein